MQTAIRLTLLTMLLLIGACAAGPKEKDPDRPVATEMEARDVRAEALGHFRNAYAAYADEARRVAFDRALALYQRSLEFYLKELAVVRSGPVRDRNLARETYFLNEIEAVDRYITWIIRDRPLEQDTIKEGLQAYEKKQAQIRVD